MAGLEVTLSNGYQKMHRGPDYDRRKTLRFDLTDYEPRNLVIEKVLPSKYPFGFSFIECGQDQLRYSVMKGFCN